MKRLWKVEHISINNLTKKSDKLNDNFNNLQLAMMTNPIVIILKLNI